MELPSSPPGSVSQSCSLQPDATDIAGLVNDFSRFHTRDAGDATNVSRDGRTLGRSSGTHDHDSMDSSDDGQSGSSDGATLDDHQADHGQSEMVDRIMKSFCASLDSKIAVIKGTGARLGKQEQEPDSLEADVTEARDERAEAVRKKRSNLARLREKRASAAAERLQTGTAPGSGDSPRSRRSVTALVRGLVAAPAPVPAPPPMQPQLAAPPAPAPRPPPLPGTALHSSLRSSSSIPPGVPFPPPPPPPPPMARSPFRSLMASSRGTAQNAVVSQAPETAQYGRLGPLSTDDVYGSFSTRRQRQGQSSDPLSVQTFADTEPPVIRSELVAAAQQQGRNSISFSGGLLQGRPVGTPRRGLAGSTDEDGQPAGFAESSHPVDAATLDSSQVASPDQEMQQGFIGYTQRRIPGAGFSLQEHRFGAPSALFDRDTLQPTQNLVAPPAASPQDESEDQPVPPKMKRLFGVEERRRDAMDAVEEEADGDGRRKRTRRVSSHAVVAGANGNRKFACPYFKRNPRKYRKWTSCPGPGWDEVHRVKTHLYRRHTLPIQCPRCWEVFKADGQLQSHLQQDPPCAVQGDRMLHEGFTKDQEKKLRSRKKTHADMTDEDKWREIYKILFPDDDPDVIPSPFYSESDTEGSSHDLNGSGVLEDYATFIRREMPTLVRRELETLFREEFQDVEERIRPRIAEIVLNLQPRLLGLYRQSQMPLSEYGPQQHEQQHAADTTSGSEPASTPLLSQGTDPTTGTDPDSTPDTAFAATDLNFYDNGLGASWDALYPYTQTDTQAPDADPGMGLDWDLEFDKLLNPLLFMPVPEQMQHEFDSGPAQAA